MLNELPSEITFHYPDEVKSYNMQRNCSWFVSGNPAWLELSNDEFEACEAATLTLTANIQDRNNQDGSFEIQDIEGETQATIPVYWRPSDIIVNKTRSVGPAAQQVVFDLNVPTSQLRVESHMGTLTTTFDNVNDKLIVAIPANEDSQGVVYTVELLSDRSGATDSLTISQSAAE